MRECFALSPPIVEGIVNRMSPIEFITVDEPKFRALYHSCTEKFDFESETFKEAFRNEYYIAIEVVERAVANNWKKEVDFEFQYDYDFYYCLAAGVYTHDAFCQSFIETVANSLLQFNKDHIWAIHLAIEIPDNSPFGDSFGEVLIRDKCCYVDGDRLVRPLDFL